MAKALTTTIKVNVQATYTDPLDLVTAQDPLSFLRTISLATGTGASQADRSFHDIRTLASGANEALDLAGVLADAFGDTLTFVKVKAIYVKNLSTTDDLLIGGAAANALALFANSSDILQLRPGGIFLVSAPDADGIAVGANDQLKLEHNADTTTSFNYEIVIIGTSA